jgi:methyl-accepting chemotaxis protein
MPTTPARSPKYDASGRYMPYYTRGADGSVTVEPIVFTTRRARTTGTTSRRRTRGVYFTEPYSYPINGKDVMMASLVAPIVVGGEFKGAASADFR